MVAPEIILSSPGTGGTVKENYEILGYDNGFIESIQDIFIEMYSSLI